MNFPGPWTIEGEFDAEVSVMILDTAGNVVVEKEPFLEEWTAAEIATAHLIAAAPDLLAEARTAAKVFRECAADTAGTPTEASFLQLLGNCEAAIAKAEGKR